MTTTSLLLRAEGDMQVVHVVPAIAHTLHGSQCEESDEPAVAENQPHHTAFSNACIFWQNWNFVV